MTRGPLNSPIAQAIDAHAKSLGGSPLRHRMLEGKAQFWTVIGGRVYAAPRLALLAGMVGAPLNGATKMSEATVAVPTDLISANRAATITGYSASAIYQAGIRGEIKQYPVGIRRKQFSRADVERWGEEHRKAGNNTAPRRSPFDPKPKKNVRVFPPRVEAEKGSSKSYHLDPDVHSRMMRTLARFDGTPFAMTARQFCTDAVRVALDKLGKLGE